jgi:hypothetical protein
MREKGRRALLRDENAGVSAARLPGAVSVLPLQQAMSHSNMMARVVERMQSVQSSDTSDGEWGDSPSH